jgi:hypothetical protein
MHRIVILLVAGALALAGCPKEEGCEGCPCYGNGTCDDGLVCNASNVCEDQGEGCEGCPCYGNGTCNDGLVCNASDICEPGGTDGGATDGGASDGGASDGGASDGGASDGGATDGGATDSGTPGPCPVASCHFVDTFSRPDSTILGDAEEGGGTWVETDGASCPADIFNEMLHIDIPTAGCAATVANTFPEASGTVTVEARFRVSNSSYFNIEVYSGSGDSRLTLYVDSGIYAYGATTTSLASFLDDTWYEVRIEFDTAADLATHIWIDDIEVGTDLALANSGGIATVEVVLYDILPMWNLTADVDDIFVY